MFVRPMLLHKSEPFSHSDWIFEPKFDGFRLIVTRINGKLKMYTRHHNDVTNRFPELQEIPIEGDFILDGEVVCYFDGRVDFERVMERFHAKREEKRKQLPIYYVVFDILYHEGQDLKNLPLWKRKEILHLVLEDTETVSKIKFIQGEGEKFFSETKKIDLEGMCCKKADSKYITNHRSKDWLKVINWKYVDVVITGYRKEKFGWK